MPLTCPVALVYTHGLGPAAQGGNGDEDVVHGRHEKDGKAQEAQDGQVSACVRIVRMTVRQTDDAEVELPSLKLQRCVFLHHPLNMGIYRVNVLGTAQAKDGVEHVVAFPAKPVAVASVGMDGAHKVIVPQEGIVRHIPVDAAHGQPLLLVQQQFPAHGVLVSENLLREALRKEDGIALNHLLRESLQYLNAHRVEERGVGLDIIRVLQQFVPFIDILVAIIADDGGRLHPLRHLRLQRVGSDVKEGRVIKHMPAARGAGHAVGLRESLACQYQSVGLRIASLVVQFVGYLRKEQHAHQQPQRQRHQLDEGGRAATAQGLNCIV